MTIVEFCGEKNFVKAYKILDVVEGLKPDVGIYYVKIGWLCKVGKCSEANGLFRDMPRFG